MSSYITKSRLKYARMIWEKGSSVRETNHATLDKNFKRMIEPGPGVLDDQTWADLDMNRNFNRINRTFSNMGQQQLYNMSRILQFDEDELKRRDRVIRWLQQDTDNREKIQCMMQFLGRKEVDSAAECLYGGLKHPWGKALIWPATATMLAAFLSIIFLGRWSLPILMIVMVINIFIHFMFNQGMDNALPGIRGVARMIEAAKELHKQNISVLDDGYNDCFSKTLSECLGILWQVRFYGAGVAADPLGITNYLQVIFLAQERTYLGCAKLVDEHREVLSLLYKRLGELDALQAVASFRGRLSPCCMPEFTDEKNLIEAVQLGHPSLENAVCNDVSLIHKNMALTGSNISGKSTFPRTVGYNAVLAQTFYMVKAKQYRTSFF